MKTLSRTCALAFLFLLFAETSVAQQPAGVKSQHISSQQRTVLSQMADQYTAIEAFWFKMRATAWGYAVSAKNQEIIGSRSNDSGDQYGEAPFYFVGR